jgi:hypothetical protein
MYVRPHGSPTTPDAVALRGHRHRRPAPVRSHHPPTARPPPPRWTPRRHRRATRPGRGTARSHRGERERPWAVVVADITTQHRAHDQQSHLRDLDAHPPRPVPARRAATSRSGTGSAPTLDAAPTDQDHTRDHAAGGPTTTTTPTDAGTFVWISPLGRTYPTQPEPILPPPPREHDPWFDEPGEPTDEPLHLHTRGRAPPAPSPDPTGPEPADEQPVDIDDDLPRSDCATSGPEAVGEGPAKGSPPTARRYGAGRTRRRSRRRGRSLHRARRPRRRVWTESWTSRTAPWTTMPALAPTAAA